MRSGGLWFWMRPGSIGHSRTGSERSGERSWDLLMDALSLEHDVGYQIAQVVTYPLQSLAFRPCPDLVFMNATKKHDTFLAHERDGKISQTQA
jgi:hypothetical protein